MYSLFIFQKDWDEKAIYGDAAILILERPLELNDAVSTICLPDSGVIIPDKAVWNGY